VSPLSGRIADFVAEVELRDVPQAALVAAKTMMVDALACAFAATGTEIRASLGRVLATEAAGESTVIGFGERVQPPAAALLNGSLIHAVDFDDIPHFTAVELPPAMGVLEARGGSGEDLLTAFVAGYEVAARLTATLAHGRPQHPIGLVGPVAAAVVAGRLERASRAELQHALGIAASLGSGLAQNFGTFTKPLHAGHAAEAGLRAVQLARCGWTADPSILEGPKGFLAAYGDEHADVAFDGDFWMARAPADRSGGSALDPHAWPPALASGPLAPGGAGAPPDRRRGGPNLSRGPSIKPWPACGGNNAALTALYSALLAPGFDRSAIDAVEIVVPADPTPGALFRTDPASGLEGKFSLRYGVAASWLDGRLDVESFEDSGFRRIKSSGLLERVTVRVDPEFVRRDDDCNWAAVRLHMKSGEVVVSRAFNRGLELAEDAVRTKYETYVVPVLGRGAADEALAAVLELEALDDCRPMIRRWAADHRAQSP
jgi:2-methylcitrate dehydratase PrpD